MAAKEITIRGFSVLELLIVLAVVSVLLTLAIPSYQRYTQRTNRAETIRMMLGVADCQERIRAMSGFYDTSRCGEGLSNDSHKLWIEPADSTASLEFTIIAEPRQGRTDACGKLSLDQAGTREISGDQEALGNCWGGR